MEPACDNILPVTYGVVPAGMQERVKATPLRPAELYWIEAWDGSRYSGAFRITRDGIVEKIEERR